MKIKTLKKITRSKIKEKIVRPNIVRNYSEHYQRNIKDVIGRKLLTEVKPIHCQKILSDMADEGYRTSTIYQTCITLFNMMEFAKENDVIIINPCKKLVKSDMGKPSEKKEALTIETQKAFLEVAAGQSYENQFRFILTLTKRHLPFQERWNFDIRLERGESDHLRVHRVIELFHLQRKQFVF